MENSRVLCYTNTCEDTHPSQVYECLWTSEFCWYRSPPILRALRRKGLTSDFSESLHRDRKELDFDIVLYLLRFPDDYMKERKRELPKAVEQFYLPLAVNENVLDA